MTTPKSHRPWFRDLIDRIDNYIAGPDGTAIPWTDFLPQEILDAEIEATPTERFDKVSPNVDHTPPTMTCRTHGPGCPNLALERELVDLEWQQDNAYRIGYADAVDAWNRGEL